MKTKLILIVNLLFFVLIANAQIWAPGSASSTTDDINREGNVGIGITAPQTPNSKLSINGAGSQIYAQYIDATGNQYRTSGGRGIYVKANNALNFNGWVRALDAEVKSGHGYTVAVDAEAFTPNPSTKGRAYGVFAAAGNSTNGANYGVYSELKGSNNGSAIFGWDRVKYPVGSGLMPANKSYAGYFIGKGHFSDNLGLQTSNPLSPLSVNGDGDSKYTAFFHTNSTENWNTAVFGLAARPTVFDGKFHGVVGKIESGVGYARGVYGESFTKDPSDEGRSYGFYGLAGNATIGANFGVHGIVDGKNSGAAVFGWNRVAYPSGDGHLPTGTVPRDVNYGGYFIGKGYFSDNVGIGVRNPKHELEVCGTIRAKEVKVESDWCDYVFAEEYKMPTLEEEAQHIQEKGYLLSFESAEEMDGKIRLGDVTKRQQETIEKLMLHMIEMDKEMKALKAQLEARN